MHRYWALAADLSMVAVSPFIAVLIRDNFVVYQPHLEAITAYAVIVVAVSIIVFAIAGPYKVLWRCTALPDVLRVVGAVTAALLLALFASFTASRLEGVARSVPVIQWLLLVGATMGARIGARVWHEHAQRHRFVMTDAAVQRVLIVGVNHLTELYLRTLAAYGASTIEVLGLLSDQPELCGRAMWRQQILGTPEELLGVIAQLEVHGVTVGRIAVMQPFGRLSRGAAKALLAVEQGSDVKVDWIVERLGLTEAHSCKEEPAPNALHPAPQRLDQPAAGQMPPLSLGKYGYLKRGFDILAALLFSAILAPLFLAVALLVGLDVGFPLIFWQQRPGRFGRPFKLFKFCTMRPGHDGEGNRVPDELRLSKLGRLLRRTRFDELPQLYNILIGEMSFVGPRPLLPVDQPNEVGPRLLVRPGLTGLAQVHGGRNISAEDKNALDISYIRSASLWLDIKILLRTFMVLIRGERVDHDKMHNAWVSLGHIAPSPGNLGSHLFESKSVMGGKVEVVHSGS
jgi:lipopolysaccharide/colanic/teichoic acid biosynthesis glycosyltransferase